MDQPLRAVEYTGEYGKEISTIAQQEKFKSQPSAGKLTFTIFWDSKGPVLEHIRRGAQQ
jgi:hypothetical protein